jgi:3-hydroxyisobutyrate dehydrogenase-like beta-hydroxyacid dehydrogenase
MDLGLAAGERLGVPMEVAQLTRELVQKSIDAGHTECDFAILLEEQAKISGLDLHPEDVEVSDGLK